MSTNNYYNITNRHRNTRSTNYYYVCHRIIYAFVLLLSIGELPALERVESVPLVVDNKSQTKSREPITLEEAFLGELRAKDFDFDWLSTKGSGDSELIDQLIYDDSKNILLVTLPSIERRNATNFNIPSPGATQKNQQILTNFEPNVTVLVSNSSLLSTIEFQGYKLSPSRQYLLLWNSRRKQFRHSFTAKYFLYDIKRDLVSLLSTKQSQVQPQSASATYSPIPFEDENEYMRFKVVDWYSTETTQGLVDSLIMIQNNDIYKLYDVSRLVVDTQNLSSTDTKRDPMVSANHALPIRLTYTGREGVIFNGVPDWLYEEEILGDTPAFQVSPSSSHLAYMSFDDSHVNIMPYTIYGDRIIPRVQLLRYPKTGQPNPQVTVRVIENFSHLDEVESKSNNGVQMVLPDDLGHEQHYINRIQWLTNEKLALIWSSRNQSNSFVIICSMLPSPSNVNSSAQWKCEKNLNMKAENGWLDIGDDLLPLNADYYLALVPKFEGAEVGNFKHIAKVSIKEPNKFVYLTSGRKEVIAFNGVDYKRSLVYYTSTVANEPGQRQLFVTELDSTSTHKNITLDVLEASSTSVCVTCDHHLDECLYNYAKMSPSTNYYMFHCSGPGVPRVELRATRRRRHRNFFENLVNDTRQQKFLNHPTQGNESNVLASDGSNGQNSPSLLWTFEDNRKLRDKLENHKMMPLTLRAHIPIDGTGYQADALILLPPNLFGSARSPTANKLRTSSKYLTLEQINELSSTANNGQQLPMVVDVYGGPGSQRVDYRFGINFGHYLASSKQIVYVMIDGRGSGYQGSKRLYELYHKLGTVEIQDQIDVASHLARFLWFVDPTRVAIWGWSYGGYAAAMSLAQSKLRANNELAHNQKLVQNQTDPGTISESVFKCAASVAPVTHWIYYDTAYTEKYMSSPWANEKYDNLYPGDHLYNNEVIGRQPVFIQSPSSIRRDPFVANKWTPLNQTLNSGHIQSIAAQHILDLIADTETNRSQRVSSPTNQQQVNNNNNNNNKNQIDLNDRYRKASLLEQAANFDSNSFLLIHGTADDNVNFQQSIMLMKRFIKKNVLFETRLYPDQDHGIAEKADKFHLGSTLSDFLISCLGRV
uniref:Dipeptidyl peptidase 4 n=1 Tax=Aceria tosichella TaxID=561515 RepID=A0A6G1SDA3_9ACAR